MPPGGTRAILPAAVLFPPQGAYQDITLPSLDSVIQRGAETGPVAAPPANSQPAPLLGGTATLFAQGLQQPRGIALAPDGRIYVAEGGSGKLQVFDAAGNALGLLPQGAETIGEPSDVAVDSSSDPASDPASIVVLDAAIGRVWRFALDGSAQPDVVIDGGLAQAGRGLTVGPDGRVWVASTARSVLAGSALDANTLQDNGQDGGDPITVALTGGEGAQPTDVVVGQGGALFVADPVRQRLDRYSPFGTLEQGWPLPIANTLDSPHLAVDAAGRIYVTDPEAGRVELRDHTGEAIGAWDVAGLLGHPVKLVGIAVAPDGALWLTDSTGGSVIVLRP
jgi:DNA-binding beta-propeller fold protein YncE